MIEPITAVGWISVAMLGTAGPVAAWRGVRGWLKTRAIRKGLEAALRSRFRTTMEGEVLEADVKGLPAKVRITELKPDYFSGGFSYAVALSPPFELETSYEIPILTPSPALPKIEASVPGLGADHILRGRPEAAVRAALTKLEGLRDFKRGDVTILELEVSGSRLQLGLHVPLGERPVERLLQVLSAGAELAFRLMS